MGQFDRAGTRRVFIEDMRRDGKYLRCTWHGDRNAFVLSTWDGDVCTGATRMGPADGARLLSVLAEGVADATSELAEAAFNEPEAGQAKSAG
jgi:hypothetical protein